MGKPTVVVIKFTKLTELVAELFVIFQTIAD